MPWRVKLFLLKIYRVKQRPFKIVENVFYVLTGKKQTQMSVFRYFHQFLMGMQSMIKWLNFDRTDLVPRCPRGNCVFS